MCWRPAPLGPPPPMVWSLPRRRGRRWDCSGSAPGALEGPGTAAGVLLAFQKALGLQWECSCISGGHWDCRERGSDEPNHILFAVRAFLTMRIALQVQCERF